MTRFLIGRWRTDTKGFSTFPTFINVRNIVSNLKYFAGIQDPEEGFRKRGRFELQWLIWQPQGV
jgi:hypothetical protein